jgi:hypothetical protein
MMTMTSAPERIFQMNENNLESKTLPTTVAATPSAVAAINQYIAVEDAQATIGKLIKHTKGEFLKGQDLEVVPEGSLFTVACDLTFRGFIRWRDGKPAGHRIVRLASGAPLPRREDLGDIDKTQWPRDNHDKPRDPWQPVMYLPMMDADGELATFTTNAVSGIKSLNRLLRRYATHAARHPNDYPLVKLRVAFFMHSDKAIGKVFYPDFEPAGYVDKAEFCEALEAVGFDVNHVDVNRPEALPKPGDEIDDEMPF